MPEEAAGTRLSRLKKGEVQMSPGRSHGERPTLRRQLVNIRGVIYASDTEVQIRRLIYAIRY